MPAEDRVPTPSNPWTMACLPIVIGWVDDDRPLLMAGPPSASDPWSAADGWGVVHVVSTQVADNVDRRGGKEATLRRLTATARAHGWPWLPVATARPDGSHHALGIAVRGLPRATAVELARGAGQSVVLELGPERLRIIDLLSGQISTVRRRHHPVELRPPWLTSGSELLTVWRGRHRAALEPIGAGKESGTLTPPGQPTDRPGRAAPATSCSDRH